MAGSTFERRLRPMNPGSGQIIRFPSPGKAAARPVLAASIAVFREGQVLLATRTKPPADQLWSLPGGKVEAGETLEQAALRELEEEVGVRARILSFNRHVEIFGRDPAGAITHHFVVASFVGAWISGEAQPGPEAGAVMWVDPLKLGGLPTTRELGDVLRRAHRLFIAAGDA